MATEESRIVKLEKGWLSRLEDEFAKPYMSDLREFLLKEKTAGKVIFPRGDEYFNAMNTTPFDRVKVVIIGQDPYHGPRQAHGLCFSVSKEIEIPPSLKNIYRELQMDLGIPPASHGCLTSWAEQGVLLLNAVLTVEMHRPASHQGRGWEQFTDRVITVLNENREHIVFLLWGSYAQRKGAVIDRNRHLVLEAPHPSPFSAGRGFFGCRHFSRCNAYLEKHGIAPVDWHAE